MFSCKICKSIYLKCVCNKFKLKNLVLLHFNFEININKPFYIYYSNDDSVKSCIYYY